MKFCKDCKHFVVERTSLTSYRCAKTVDPIIGHPLLCSIERSVIGVCGIEGRNYEPLKESADGLPLQPR